MNECTSANASERTNCSDSVDSMANTHARAQYASECFCAHVCVRRDENVFVHFGLQVASLLDAHSFASFDWHFIIQFAPVCRRLRTRHDFSAIFDVRRVSFAFSNTLTVESWLWPARATYSNERIFVNNRKKYKNDEKKILCFVLVCYREPPRLLLFFQFSWVLSSVKSQVNRDQIGSSTNKVNLWRIISE